MLYMRMGRQEAPQPDLPGNYLKERRPLAHANPNAARHCSLATWLDLNSAAHTTFISKLYGQQWVYLRYNIMREELFQQLIN